MSEEESLQLESTEDLVTNQRVEGIFDGRRRVRKVRHALKEHGETGFEACSSYRTALEAYLQEIHPLFLSSSTGIKYWRERDFGEVILSPDDEVTVVGRREEKRFALAGLRSLFHTPDPISKTFRVRRRRGARTVVENEEVTVQIPFPTLDSMFFVANEFLPEVGIQIQIEEDKDPAKI